MVQNRSKMLQNWSKSFKIGPKSTKMVQNGPKLSKIGPIWSKPTENDPKMVPNGSKSVQNGTEWYKMVQQLILGDFRNSAKSFRGISPLQPTVKKNSSKTEIATENGVNLGATKKNREKTFWKKNSTQVDRGVSTWRWTGGCPPGGGQGGCPPGGQNFLYGKKKVPKKFRANRFFSSPS